MVKRILSDSSAILEDADGLILPPDVSKVYKDGTLDMERINRISALATPRERLLVLLKSTLWLDESTHESKLIHQAMTFGFFTGITLGYIGKGAERHRDFIRNYNMAVFENVYIAKRKYLDTYISQGLIKSAKFGVQVAVLGGACCGALIVPMSLRDDDYSVVDSTLAMGVVCGLARFNLGIKAMTVGSLLGMGFGSLGGLLVKSYLSLSGKTPQEIRFWNHANYVQKKMQKLKQMEKDKEPGA